MLVSVGFEPLPALVTLQNALVQALAPFSQSSGTAAAFFTTPAEPQVSDATIAYVESFVSEHTGPRYEPHVTVGIGRVSTLERLKRASFEPFAFVPPSVAAYQLGDFGTARRSIVDWALQPVTSRASRHR